MGRLPVRDYNTQSYYVSRSFATSTPGVSCVKLSDGRYSFTSNGTNGTGTTCSLAQSDWIKNVNAKTKANVPQNQQNTKDPISNVIQSSNPISTAVDSAGKGLSSAGKTIGDSVGGTSNAIQQGLGGIGKGTTDAVNSTGNWFGNIGKTITDSILGESNALQQQFGQFGQYIIPIAIGGAAILLILLLKK